MADLTTAELPAYGMGALQPSEPDNNEAVEFRRRRAENFYKKILNADRFPFGDQCVEHAPGDPHIATVDIMPEEVKSLGFEQRIDVASAGGVISTRVAVDFDAEYLCVCVTPFVIPSPVPVNASVSMAVVGAPPPLDTEYASKLGGRVVAQVFLYRRSPTAGDGNFPFTLIHKTTFNAVHNLGGVFDDPVEISVFQATGILCVYNATKGVLCAFYLVDPRTRQKLVSPDPIWSINFAEEPVFGELLFGGLEEGRSEYRVPPEARFVYQASKIIGYKKKNMVLLVTGASPIHVHAVSVRDVTRHESYAFANPPWEVMKQLGHEYRDTPGPPRMYLINLFVDEATELPMANFMLQPAWSLFYTRLVTQLDRYLDFEWFWGGIGRDTIPDNRAGEPPHTENINTGRLCHDGFGTWATLEGEPDEAWMKQNPNSFIYDSKAHPHNCLVYRASAPSEHRLTVYLNASPLHRPSIVPGIQNPFDAPVFLYNSGGPSAGPYKVPGLPMIAYLGHSLPMGSYHTRAALHLIDISRVHRMMGLA